MSKQSPETDLEHPLPYLQSRNPRHPSKAPTKISPPLTEAIIPPISSIKYSPHLQDFPYYSHQFHESDRQHIERVPYDSIYGSSRIAYPAYLYPPVQQGHKWFPSKPVTKRQVTKSTKQLEQLMRARDMLHFILSYHVKLVREFDDSKLQTSIFKVNGWIDTVINHGTQPPHSIHELPFFMYASYIPDRWKLICIGMHIISQIIDPIVKQIPTWAIESAIRQASKCILEANMRLIAISGQKAGEVGKALKNIPKIQSKFDAVLYISVSPHQGIIEVNEWIQKQIDEFIQPDKSKTYSFLVIMDCLYTIAYQTLEPIINHDHVCVVLATPSDDIYGITLVDVGIRMEYHLLPLEVFCQLAEKKISGNVLSSAHKDLALYFLEHCHGDLAAVEMLATELSRDHSLGVWKAALHELKSRPSSHVENGVNEPMIRVLTFLWKRKDAITKLCIQQLASYSNQEELTTTSLVSCWLASGLVQTEGEGEEIIDDLTKSCLLMRSRPYGPYLSMGERVADFLLKYVIPALGLPLKATAIVEDAEIINLRNSEETELPDCPICPHLVLLSLQNNCDVMMIPPLFFEHMPMLLRLNLSGTSIKTLPASISSLVLLRRLYLRSCDLFLELPPEIGQLSELEVIDLEGTKVMYLPSEIARLKKLRQLKLSFYAYGGSGQESKQRIPKGLLSNLESLQELWIGLNPDEDNDESTADVEKILIQLPKRSGRSTLVSILMHVPDTRLLEHLPNYRAYNYKLIVGRCGQRMISRIPSGVEEKFKKQKKLLKYVNGKHIPTEIVNILRYSEAFILDRHWTVKSLSEFATESIYSLQLCMLVECNELQTILDEDEERFTYIRHLYVYYMKSLNRLCTGPVTGYPLYNLKFLSLCTCTVLDSAFSISLLSNLPNLEELVLEDCPKMESLVTCDCAWVNERHILPRLKKMSLRQLPQLVSISNGLQIAPKLEKLVFFYCPKLESISEVLGENLKVIKGETEWWDSLPWQETDPLENIFVPLRMDGDLMAQFTEDALQT